MLDDVEIVYFERVKVSKTFDLVFVTKDEEYDIVSINHVPSVHLNALTEHFKRIDIKVYQGKYNINWAEVLEFITEKPEEFEACGWKFIEGGEELTHVEDEVGGVVVGVVGVVIGVVIGGVVGGVVGAVVAVVIGGVVVVVVVIGGVFVGWLLVLLSVMLLVLLFWVLVVLIFYNLLSPLRGLFPFKTFRRST
eukprot:TRINITY_DN692_c0_g2_i11.p1 TRINITY_DN692_c0_g2~~TRINITY_DN692_c0_g2_i11.p1  ORF type:complete len:193 (+),score=65.20 TRINITY_DN692_c0_g2_i11:1158-1736(+)